MVGQSISRQVHYLFVWLVAISTGAVSAHGALIHRYSFNDGTARDSVGKVDGALKGPAASIADGKLVLKNDANSTDAAKLSYLEFSGPVLPASGTSVSLVFWFSAKDTGPYARVLNFGDREGGEGRAFMYFTPRTADEQSRAAITATDVSGRVPLDNDRLDDGKMHMVAVIIDGSAKKMHVFIDGKEPRPAEDLGENTLDKVHPIDNFLGRSSFDVDPGLNGSIDEFRVYDQALTGEEILAIQKAGPDSLPSSPARPAAGR